MERVPQHTNLAHLAKKSIWLKGIKFLLPKGLPSPKFSTFSDWSMRVIFQSFIPFLSSSK